MSKKQHIKTVTVDAIGLKCAEEEYEKKREKTLQKIGDEFIKIQNQKINQLLQGGIYIWWYEVRIVKKKWFMGIFPYYVSASVFSIDFNEYGLITQVLRCCLDFQYFELKKEFLSSLVQTVEKYNVNKIKLTLNDQSFRSRQFYLNNPTTSKRCIPIW